MREKDIFSGKFNPRSCSTKKSAKNHKERFDDVIVIDDDEDNDPSSDVIVIDIPESLQDESEEPAVRRRQNDFVFKEVISIDDDNDESNVSNQHGVGAEVSNDLDSDATSKKPACSADNYCSRQTPSFCANECTVTREKGCASKSKKCRGTFKTAFCGNRYGLYSEDESSSSDSEFPDCEIMEDSCGEVREQWQRASLRRKNPVGPNDQGSASCSMNDTQKNVELGNKSAQLPEATACSNSSNSSCDKDKSAAFAETPADDIGTGFLDPGRQTNVDFDQKYGGFYFSKFRSEPIGNMHTCRRENRPSERKTCGERLFSAEKRENHGHKMGGSTGECTEEEQSPEGSSLRSNHYQYTNGNSSNTTPIPDKEPKFTRQAHQSDLKSQLDADIDKKFPASDGEEDIFKMNYMNKTPFDCGGAVFTDNEVNSSIASDCCNVADSWSKKWNSISKNTDKAFPGQPVITRHSERAEANCSDASGNLRGNKETSFVSNPPFGKSGIRCPGACLEVDRLDPVDKPDEPLIDSRNIRDKCRDREILQADSNVTASTCGDMIINREKLKETDEYKRAMEAEWVSRQEQLRIQAEEAQRLRKRKRAESLRLSEMERRQKQRLEEIRDTLKKDEEDMNLKEQLRGIVRKELHMLELKSYDMASLLRGLGINVGGGVSPSSQEVHAAYKRAVLRFHPDRATRSDIRQQVESEEKFKLIARMKEKFLKL